MDGRQAVVGSSAARPSKYARAASAVSCTATVWRTSSYNGKPEGRKDVELLEPSSLSGKGDDQLSESVPSENVAGRCGDEVEAVGEAATDA